MILSFNVQTSTESPSTPKTYRSQSQLNKNALHFIHKLLSQRYLMLLVRLNRNSNISEHLRADTSYSLWAAVIAKLQQLDSAS